MIYMFTYIQCPRCHGTKRAITGSKTTRTGAEAIYAQCKECTSGNQLNVAKSPTKNLFVTVGNF